MHDAARSRQDAARSRRARCAALAAFLLLAPGGARAQLAGLYTIGGTDPDFASFAEAVAALESQGVGEPAGATFLVRAGTYTAGAAPVLSLGPVPNASESRRVTFRADFQTGASAEDVILERSDAPGTLTDPFLVDLRSDHVTLRELTFRNGDTASTSTTNGSFVRLYASHGQRRDIEIDDCVLQSRGLSQAVIAVAGNTATFQDLRIFDNHFDDLVIGVQLAGFASSYADVRIERNRFTGLRYRPNAQGDPLGSAVRVEMGGQRLSVRSNDLDYSGGAGQVGIVLIANATDFRIEANQIRNVFAGGLYGGFTGILTNGASSSGHILNNMISIHTVRRIGLSVRGDDGVVVAHNTVYLPARGIDFFGGSSALQLCASNLEVFGNVLVDLGTGTNNRTNALQLQSCANTDNRIEGNLLYSAEGAFAIDGNTPIADLAAWQALGYGAGSVSKLPEVVNVHADLHLAGCSAGDPDLYGPASPLVRGDVDGRIRPLADPMMGAHESRAGFATPFGAPALYEPFAGSVGTTLYLDAADFDGDGDVDLVASVIGAEHAIALLANQGDGSFAPLEPIDRTPADPTIVQAADIDGDGAVDVAAAIDGATYLEIHWGTGGGSFSAPAQVPLNQQHTIRERLGISDFELVSLGGDGSLDLVFTDAGIPSADVAGELGVICNFGGRNFFDEGTLLPGPPHPYDLVVSDMDGDGDPDAVVNSASLVGAYGVLENGGGCPFAPAYKGANHYAAVESAPLLPNLAAADLDGDGLADLVFDDALEPSPGDEVLPLLFNQGLFTFAVEETFVDTAHSRAPGPIAPIDYEGDGDVDLLVGNETTDLEADGELVLLENDGGGGFAPVLVCGESKLPRQPRMLVSDDFDGDGRPDFAAVLEGRREIAVVLQAVPEPGTAAASLAAAAALAVLARLTRSRAGA